MRSRLLVAKRHQSYLRLDRESRRCNALKLLRPRYTIACHHPEPQHTSLGVIRVPQGDHQFSENLLANSRISTSVLIWISTAAPNITSTNRRNPHRHSIRRLRTNHQWALQSMWVSRCPWGAFASRRSLDGDLKILLQLCSFTML